MFQKNKYICCFGEVLWDDFPSGRLPGGAPMNVAVGLQNLGIQSIMISKIGKDELGEEIKAFLASKNCTTQWIQTDETHGTGIVKVHTTTSGENSYEIVQPIAWDFISVNDETLEAVSNAKALVFGSLACRGEVSKNTLLALLKKAQLKVFDVNFRAPFYSKEIVEELMPHTDIVKMNDDELEIIAAWYDWVHQNTEQQMRCIKDKFDLKTLIVTRGANGAALLDSHDFYESKGFKVEVKDTVGSGDAFLAGFLKSTFEGKKPQEALQRACALGALVASHTGANPIINESDIEKIIIEQSSIDLKINNLQHIGLPVTNMKVSEAFYQKLGFDNAMSSTFEFNGEKGGIVAMMKRGNIIIELYQMPETELAQVRQRKDGRIDHIAFDVDDIDVAFETLKNAGYKIFEPEPVFLAFWERGCKYFNIEGPDGERLEFNQIL